MKLIADHIKKFDKMVHKFERFLKAHFPKHLEEENEDLVDRFENYIYFDDEYMKIRLERSLAIKVKK